VNSLPGSKVPSYVPIASPVYKLLENSNYNSFEIIEPLGKGGFGSVFKVRHILDQ